MKLFPKARFSISSLAMLGTLALASGTGEQMTFVPWTGGNWKSEWPGVENRTYFYQVSPDLTQWHYSPFMAFGSGGHEFFVGSSSPKLFVRLHHHDDPSLTTLQQAKDADFDGDALPNWEEVTTEGTRPFDWDTDGDLIPDGLEVLLGSSPIINSSGDDDDGDGMKNAEEYLAGRDPSTADPVADSSNRQLDVFNLSPF